MKRLRSLAVLLLTVTILLASSCGADNRQRLREYLEPYKEQALAYLKENEEITADYGTLTEAEATAYSFTYEDPSKYAGLSLSPKLPATPEEFAREVKELEVSFAMPDGRACTVRFEKSPEGGLEIVEWRYNDQEET